MFQTPTKNKKALLEEYRTPPTKRKKTNTDEIALPNGQTITVYYLNPSNATRAQIEDNKLRKARKKKYAFYTIKTMPPGQDQPYKENMSQDSDDRKYLKLPNDNVVKLFRFVISTSGDIICGPNHPNEHVSHGAIVNDSAVFAAGELGMDEKNKLCYVSNRTGHYRIPPTTLALVYSYLIDKEGYSTNEIKEIYEGTYTAGEDDSLSYSIQQVGDHFIYQASAFKDYTAQPSEHLTDNNDKNSSTSNVLNTNFTVFSTHLTRIDHNTNNLYVSPLNPA